MNPHCILNTVSCSSKDMYVIYLTQVLLPKKNLVVDVFFELCYKIPNELMVVLSPRDLWQLHTLFVTHNIVNEQLK